jgi:hypothetical protein
VTEVTWRDAEKSDRPRLQKFVCFDPLHPELTGRHALRLPDWQHVVHCGIRELKPSPRGPRICVVGDDGEDLVAVAWADQHGEPGRWHILCVAVAVAHRGHRYGEAISGQLVSRVMVRADAGRAAKLTVWWKVHPENGPSLAMATRLNAERWETDRELLCFRLVYDLS